MARVKSNPILEQIRGGVGDLVFERYGDEVIISRKPDLEGVEPTEAQLAAQERFRQAALYGEVAKAKGQAVFSLTVADFFNAPSVDEIGVSGYTGAAGDEIVMRASDDFDPSAGLRTGIAVTATDGSAALTTGWPSGVAEAEEGKAV